ncbi:hypothetical protein PHLCEN_2v7700 [Hermanssonia centrifuga]|uniref:Uncharacterized protein n=1 Tax=Hermanssonia centrifuga TaxID=98765 RepID=A0A2R6NVT8_9APHY|nr:hypothetical protein PHLCEN_2v7700 [Hermanssonia centrifuga]
MPPKAQSKKHTASALTQRLSTRAKNATSHPGLVDVSEDSDPENSKHKMQKKAVKAKAKAVTKDKAANLPEMKRRIAELKAQIARNNVRVLRNGSSTTAPSRSSPIVEDVDVDAVEDIDVGANDADIAEDINAIEDVDIDIDIDEGQISNVIMPDGDGPKGGDNLDNHGGDDEDSGGDTDNMEMVNESTGGPPPGYGPVHYRLRRENGAFFGCDDAGDVIIVKRHATVVNSFPIEKPKAKPTANVEPKKCKSTMHEEEDIPEEAMGSTPQDTHQVASKPVA